MKKYFAKYLPVEGEIKGRDKILIPNTGKIITNWDNSDVDKEVYSFLECKKVKLFLCSRDIQVGDKYYNQRLNLWGTAYVLPSDESDNCIKVIGEILTKGIKEGQEFTKKEMEYLTIGEINTKNIW